MLSKHAAGILASILLVVSSSVLSQAEQLPATTAAATPTAVAPVATPAPPLDDSVAKATLEGVTTIAKGAIEHSADKFDAIIAILSISTGIFGVIAAVVAYFGFKSNREAMAHEREMRTQLDTLKTTYDTRARELTESFDAQIAELKRKYEERTKEIVTKADERARGLADIIMRMMTIEQHLVTNKRALAASRDKLDALEAKGLSELNADEKKDLKRHREDFQRVLSLVRGDVKALKKLDVERLAVSEQKEPRWTAFIYSEEGTQLYYSELYEDALAAFSEAAKLSAGTDAEASSRRAGHLFNMSCVQLRISYERPSSVETRTADERAKAKAEAIKILDECIRADPRYAFHLYMDREWKGITDEPQIKALIDRADRALS